MWRDLAALQEVGFPLVDEKRDRTTFWTLLNMPLKALNDAGLSVTEACSLYLSRALLVSFTGTPFEPGLAAIIKKIEKGLSPQGAGVPEAAARRDPGEGRRRARRSPRRSTTSSWPG